MESFLRHAIVGASLSGSALRVNHIDLKISKEKAKYPTLFLLL